MGGERSKIKSLILNDLKQKKRPVEKLGVPLKKSGKRDSNSRPRPWQGRALPTELLPRNLVKSGRRVSNPLPAAWKAAALPNELLPQ